MRSPRAIAVVFALAFASACGTSPGRPGDDTDVASANDTGDLSDTTAPTDTSTGTDTPPSDDTSPTEDPAIDTAEDTRIQDTAVEDSAVSDTAVDDTAIDGTAVQDTPVEDTPPGDTTGPGLIDPDECEEICSAREALGTGGCFGEEGSGPSGSCRDHCHDIGVTYTEPEVVDAYLYCVNNDPLCFQTVEDCIYGALYPEPVEVTVTVTGAGFGDYDDLTVQGGIERGGSAMLRATPVEVVDGQFELKLTGELWIGPSQLVLLYVDVDDDGECTDADFPISARADRSLEFLDPDYRTTITPADGPDVFVCGFI